MTTNVDCMTRGQKQVLQMDTTNQPDCKYTGFQSLVQYTGSFNNALRAQTAIRGKAPSAEVKRGLKASERHWIRPLRQTCCKIVYGCTAVHEQHRRFDVDAHVVLHMQHENQHWEHKNVTTAVSGQEHDLTCEHSRGITEQHVPTMISSQKGKTASLPAKRTMRLLSPSYISNQSPCASGSTPNIHTMLLSILQVRCRSTGTGQSTDLPQSWYT